MSTSRLFQPTQVGRMILQHRVVMPALTRNRVDKTTRAVGDDVVEHYAARAAVPGTLLISEATIIAQKAGSYPNSPGIWSKEQIDKWKKVRPFLHRSQSYIRAYIDALYTGD